MARLTEHAVALGKHGAKQKWSGTTDAERKKIMELVRAAKKNKPKMSDNFALAMRCSNDKTSARMEGVRDGCERR